MSIREKMFNKVMKAYSDHCDRREVKIEATIKEERKRLNDLLNGVSLVERAISKTKTR